jgi:tryptophan-rich sensory protein
MAAHWLLALGICAIAAAFEGLCAGKDPLGALRQLRQPAWSPPIVAWIAVGIAWYGICLAGLIRLLPDFVERPAPVALLVALMLANAAANLLQFRMRRLDLALAFFVPYWLLLGAFLWSVHRADGVTTVLFGLYSLYQVYAAAWGFALWRLNRDPVV